MPAPLDTLEQAVTLARARLNDAIASIDGDVLTDTQPFTLAFINGAWRRLQEYAVSIGFSWLTDETVLSNVAVAASPDPASQVAIDWTTTPGLPANLIAPTDLWERLHAVGLTFYTMDKIEGGMPAVAKGSLNKRWQWRKGAIRLPGALFATDIRVRYAAFLADFVDSGTTPFASQNIPILRMADPLAWYLCSEVAHSRGGLDTQYFDDQAKSAMDLALTTNGETVP